MRENWIRNSEGNWYNLDYILRISIHKHLDGWRIRAIDYEENIINEFSYDKFETVAEVQDYLDLMMPMR